MIHLTAKHRYEVNGRTVLFVPKTWIDSEQLEHIIDGGLVTFSAENEHDGEKHGRYLHRSIMRPVKIEVIEPHSAESKLDTYNQVTRLPGSSGYNVWLELDMDSFPVTKRQVDGYVRTRL